MKNTKLTEAGRFIIDLREALERNDVDKIIELYEEHQNSDIEWDDTDIIPEYMSEDLDELIDECNELLYA